MGKVKTRQKMTRCAAERKLRTVVSPDSFWKIVVHVF